MITLQVPQNSSKCSPTSYRSGLTRLANPSCLFTPKRRREPRLSSPSHTTTCFFAYCLSVRKMKEREKEWCLPGSPASVRLYVQIPSPCHSSSDHTFSGKTTFLKFMLAWLISVDQVVLLCTADDNYLFYCGQVYVRSTSVGFRGLPVRQNVEYFPIWALIDMDYKKSDPHIRADSDIWPIQASSPNPVRWAPWVKQNGAALLGMPVWSMRELKEGCGLSLFSSLRSIEARG